MAETKTTTLVSNNGAELQQPGGWGVFNPRGAAGKATYPFPSPSCTKQTLIVFGFFQAFQVQFLGVLSKLQLDIYFKFKLNFIWISALDLFIYHFNIWFLETLILICKALPMHSELYQRKKPKP